MEYAEYAGTLSEIVESKDISKNQYIGDTLSGTAYKSYFRVNFTGRPCLGSGTSCYCPYSLCDIFAFTSSIEKMKDFILV